MTNADRLAQFNGWTLVSGPNALLRRWHNKHSGCEITTHPMSTLDQVAASLPHGWKLDRVVRWREGDWRAYVSREIGPSVYERGPDELSARIAAALAAWEVSSGE